MKAFPRAWLCFGLLSTLALGQVPDAMSFTIRNWISGGFDEILVSADGVLAVQSGGGILFRSLDTGKSWRPFPIPGVTTRSPLRGHSFDSASGLLYGFSTNGTYTASPRADSWVRISDKMPYFYSIDGSTLIFMNGLSVDISRDGGKTWKVIAADRFTNPGAVLAAGSCVYIGNYEGPMSISCDGGNTWKTPGRDTLSNSAIEMVSYQGAAIALTGHGLVRSQDSGKTWVRWLGNLGSDSTIRNLSRTETSLIAARWDTAVFSRSVDGGRTWVTHPFPDSRGIGGSSTPITAIGEKLVCISTLGVLASGDGGLTWAEVNQRKIKGPIQSLAVQGRAFLALTEQGISTSGDTGITWDIALASRPEAQWTTLIAAGGQVAAGGSDGVVRLSGDAGAHWSRPLPLPASDPVVDLAVFGGSAVAASAKGIWSLSVPDSAWKTFPLPAAGSFKVLGSGPAAMLVATESHLWRMRPDGSYDDLSAGIPVQKITGLWIIDDRAFAYTTDGNLRLWDPRSAAWSTLRQFDRHVLSLAGSGNHLTAATYLGFYVSTDAGTTWSSTGISWKGSGFFGTSAVTAIAFNGGSFFAGDEQGGVWKSDSDSSPVSVRKPGVGSPKTIRSQSPLGILRGQGLRVDGRLEGAP